MQAIFTMRAPVPDAPESNVRTNYPQLQDIDFRQTATDGRADVFADWYPMVNAPVTDLAVLDTSGQRPLWEQPDEFVDYMVDTVLARTTDTD